MYCVGVLISWAMPAASWPMACIRWAWANSTLHPLLFQQQPPLVDGPANHQGQHVHEAAFEVLDEVVAHAQLHGLDGDLLVAGAGDHDRWAAEVRRAAMLRNTSRPLRPGMVWSTITAS